MLYVKLYDKDDVEQADISEKVLQEGIRFQSLRSGGCGTASFVMKSDYEDDTNISIGYWIEIYDDSTTPDTLVYSGKIIEPTRELSADEYEKKLVSCMGFAQDLDEILVTISAKNCTVKQAICLLFAQFQPPNVTFNAANVAAMDTVIPGDGYSAEDAPFSQVLTDLCNIQQDINNAPYYWYVGPDKAFRTAAPPTSITKTYSMSTTVGVDGIAQSHMVKESRTGIRNKLIVTGGNKASGKPVKAIVQDLVSISTYGPRYTATNVTNAVDNGSGLIRITSASHGLSDTDPVEIAGVGGTTEANGVWAVSYVDDNTFDLIGSTFANAYTSGGTAAKIGTIQGKVSNTRIKDQATLETWGLGQLSRIAYPVITGSIEVTPPGDPSLTGQDYVRISGFTGSPTYHDYHPVSVEHRQEGYNNIVTTIQLQNFEPDLFDVFRQSVQRAEALAGDQKSKFKNVLAAGSTVVGGLDYSLQEDPADAPSFYFDNTNLSTGFKIEPTFDFLGSFAVKFKVKCLGGYSWGGTHTILNHPKVQIYFWDASGYYSKLVLKVARSGGGLEDVYTSGDTYFQSGTERTCICSYNSSTKRLSIFVDGVEVAYHVGEADTDPSGAGTIYIGDDGSTGTHPVTDQLSHIEIYGNSTATGTPRAAFPCNEGAGIKLHDSGNGYLGTLHETDGSDDEAYLLTTIHWIGNLNLNISKGTIRLADNETLVEVAADTIALSNDAVNYVFVDETGAIHVDTDNTPPSSESILIYQGTAVDGVARGLEDLRPISGVQRDGLYTGASGDEKEINLSAIPDFSRVVTAAYTATAYDSLILANAAGGAFSVTLPAEATSVGKRLTVKKTDSSANTVTISGAGTIDGAASNDLITQYAAITVECDGTNWHIVDRHLPGIDTGTTSGTFQIDSDNSGPVLKNSSGTLEVRNSGDSAYADTKVARVIAESAALLKERGDEPATVADYGQLYAYKGTGGIDAYTSVMLHGDGTDASTTITDSSLNPHAFTPHGDIQLDTAQKVFGTASILFDGTGDYADTPDSDDTDFGTGDFSVDCWIRTHDAIDTGGLDVRRICGKGNIESNNGDWTLGFGHVAGWGTGVRFNLAVRASGSITDYISDEVTLNVDTWYHFEASRSGTSLKFFFGEAGSTNTQIGSFTSSLSLSSAQNFYLGARDGSGGMCDFMKGWIDEIRVSKGIARHTAVFTPPSSAYSVAIQDGYCKDGAGTLRRIAWKLDNLDIFFDEGNVGIGRSSPTARLHLGAGTATAGTAPLKLTSGTLLSTAEAGAVEFVTDDAYITITTGAARKKFVLDDGTALISGRIPVAGTNGRLTDSTGLTYDGATFKTKDIQPIADDTYYLGKNDDDSPAAYKGLILKDTTNGKYYRVEVINGVITATDLTD